MPFFSQLTFVVDFTNILRSVRRIEISVNDWKWSCKGQDNEEKGQSHGFAIKYGS